jgi:hypothetical protein
VPAAGGTAVVAPAGVASHGNGTADGFDHAAVLGAAGTGQVERGAMVHRGADKGQAQRDVDAVAEGAVSGGKPWSWYIASTQSASRRWRGWNSVSAG